MQIEFSNLFPAMEKKNVKDGQATGFTHLEDRLHTHTCTQEQEDNEADEMTLANGAKTAFVCVHMYPVCDLKGCIHFSRQTL